MLQRSDAPGYSQIFGDDSMHKEWTLPHAMAPDARSADSY
jgi:hypothetical protein